jgi:hypothetical protein
MAREPKDVGEWVSGVFDPESSHFEKYMEVFRQNWRDVSDAISRIALLILLLTASFQLLIASKAASPTVSFAFIQLEDTEAIQKLLPAVIAFLAYDLTALANRWTDMQWIHVAIMANYYPKTEARRLNDYLVPRLPSFFRIGGYQVTEGRPFGERLEFWSRLGFATCMLGLLVLFFIYAFSRLFRLYGPTDVLVWISFGISLVVNAISAIMFISREPFRLRVPSRSEPPSLPAPRLPRPAPTRSGRWRSCGSGPRRSASRVAPR